MATFRRTLTRLRPKNYRALSVRSAATLAAEAQNQALVTTGGNAAWPAIYDARLNVSVIGGKVSAWDDALGTLGGRTPGPGLTQATPANRPDFTGVAGSGSEVIDFVSASSTILASAQDARFALSATTPVHCFTIAKVTVAGPVAGMAADPTNAATYPLMAIKPAGSNWKAEFGATAAGNDTAPDTGLPFNDGVVRVMGVGKIANNSIVGGESGNVTYVILLHGRQQQLYRNITAATAVGGGLKLFIGGLGASFVSASVSWVGYYTGTDHKAAMAAVVSLAAAFGAVADLSKKCTFAEIGDSLTVGATATDPKGGLAGSGTSSPGYVASRLNTGVGTWVAQALDVGAVHSFNYGVGGRHIQDLIDTITTEVTPLFDGLRSNGKVILVKIATNDLSQGSSAATALGKMATLATAIRALGAKCVVATIIDRGAWYTGGVLNAVGTEVQTFNAALRANAGGIYHDGIVDFEADAGNHFKINLAGAKAYTDGTYYTGGGDTTHLNDTGYASLGAIEKAYFDTNSALFFPGGPRPRLGSPRVRLHRQRGEQQLLIQQRARRIALMAVQSPYISAQALATLPALTTVSSTAALIIAAQGVATLPALSAAGTAVVEIHATTAATLPTLTAGATGTLEVQGQAAATMPALGTTATVGVEIHANAVATLPALTVIATGKTINDVEVSALATLPALTTAGATAVLIIGASAVASMPALSAAGAVATAIVAAAIASMPTLVSLAAAAVLITGQAIAVLPVLRAFTAIIVGKTTALDGRAFIYPQLSGRTRILPS